MSVKTVAIGDIGIGPGNPLILVAGPCVIESQDIVLDTAETLCRIAEAVRIPLIFKSSYEKDNRSSADLYRGPGREGGLKILQKVKKEFDIPVLSDVHRESDVDAAAEVLDILQVPAFLCQQTSLLLKIGETGRPVNVKKGQFLDPANIKSPVGKLLAAGNDNIILTERGSCFGYNQLVVDMRSIPIMHKAGFPVLFDATHAVRVYGIPSADPHGGQPEFVPVLARAAVAAGCDGVFLECHPNPAQARCDAASMLELSKLERLLRELIAISRAVRM